MSQLHVNQIANRIKELFEDKIDFSDIDANSNDFNNYLLTRSLAAYAIYTNSDCSIEEAADSVTDGYDDNGIDAIFYSTNLKKIFIVQSKWIHNGLGQPKSADVLKFCRGVKDLCDCKFDRFNDKIESKTQVINDAINAFGVKFHLILVDTGDEKKLGEHSLRALDDLMEEFNNLGDESPEIMTYFRMAQNEIYNSLTSLLDTESIKLELAIDECGVIKEPYVAYYGSVSAKILAHWWALHKRRLFNKNIRQVLGNTEVNEEIKSTIVNSPEQFWYFNNGITIIAERIDRAVVGTFNLEGAYVVNGAQTVSTIGKCGEEGIDLKDVKVHVRVISLKDAEHGFGDVVTKTNNRQNKIENRDFVSQDDEQKRIKMELAHEKCIYHIVRSNEVESSEDSIDLSEATVALACAHADIGLAVQAKRGVGKFYEDLTKGIYRHLFNSKTTGVYVLNCVMLDRTINETLKIELGKIGKKVGRKYGLLIHGNRMISHLVAQKLLSSDCYTKVIKYDKTDVASHVIEIIEGLYKIQENHFADNLLGTLYKNKTKCSDMKALYVNAI